MFSLDIEQLNAISPYKIQLSEDKKSLCFDTEYGLHYQVSFQKDESIFGKLQAYYILFAPSNRTKHSHKYDDRVRIVISLIIKEFIVSTNRAIVYICESRDSLQAVRQRLFMKWFNLFKKEHGNLFKISSVSYQSDEWAFFGGVIVSNGNPNAEDYITILNSSYEEQIREK